MIPFNIGWVFVWGLVWTLIVSILVWIGDKLGWAEFMVVPILFSSVSLTGIIASVVHGWF